MNKRTINLFIQAMLILAFLIAATALLMLAKTKIDSYMIQIQAQTSQVSALSDIATTPEGLEQIKNMITSVSPIIKKMTYLTYLFVPSMLFLLWSLLIGASFYVSYAEKKISSFLLSFAAISVTPFVISCYLIITILQGAGNMLMIGEGVYSLIGSALILLLTGYLTFISYALIGKHKLTAIPMRAINIAFRRMYPLLLMFMLFSIAVIALFTAAAASYLHLMSSKFDILTLYNIIVLAVLLTITVLLKETLKKIIYEKNSL